MSEISLTVPDIGDFDEVDVIEVLVAAGDTVALDQSLITLESDKASMEIPATSAGTITEVLVKVGDKIGEGFVFARLKTNDGSSAAAPTDPKDTAQASGAAPTSAPETSPAEPASAPGSDRTTNQPSAKAAPPSAEVAPAGRNVDENTDRQLDPKADEQAVKPNLPPVGAEPERDQPAMAPHASPSVRRFARELGVDLALVSPSGPKGRVRREDIQAFVKQALAAGPKSDGLNLPPMPKIDFARFGPIEAKPLGRIRRKAMANLHRSWLHVPHVTQFDEADITELEEFRNEQKPIAEKKGVKLTPLAFILKACAAALAEFPDFNASLDESGENLILKHYYHLGVAVDTPDGLVVPVIRDIDKRGVYELALELAAVSERARAGKLKPADVHGASFTVSSLGGLGGSGFTPIINAPEVAILGVAQASWQPLYEDGSFVPRLMLPLCLSYDHRVIDGAAAVRFTAFLADVLTDIRRVLL